MRGFHVPGVCPPHGSGRGEQRLCGFVLFGSGETRCRARGGCAWGPGAAAEGRSDRRAAKRPRSAERRPALPATAHGSGTRFVKTSPPRRAARSPALLSSPSRFPRLSSRCSFRSFRLGPVPPAPAPVAQRGRPSRCTPSGRPVPSRGSGAAGRHAGPGQRNPVPALQLLAFFLQIRSPFPASLSLSREGN